MGSTFFHYSLLATRHSRQNNWSFSIMPSWRNKPPHKQLTQRRQQALGGFQIRRIRALDELFEDRLQKRSRRLGSSLAGQQRRQIDCGAQLPCARALTAAEFK